MKDLKFDSNIIRSDDILTKTQMGGKQIDLWIADVDFKKFPIFIFLTNIPLV